MPFGVAAVGLVGAGVSAYEASQAAGAQSSAARNATNAELSMFNTSQANLSPFVQSGNAANNALLQGLGLSAPALTQAQQTQAFVALRNKYGGDDAQAGADFNARMAQGPSGFADLIPGLATPDTNSMAKGSLLAPFNPTEAQLQATPGYQFNLSQGEKAVTNSNAARGLGVSGAALRGAADYATGLADSTYQNQFNNYQTQQSNDFNRLMGLSTLGQNSAAQTGAFATQTGANVGSNLIGAGNAQAGANMATGTAVSGATSNVSNLLVLQSLLGKGNTGGGIFSAGANGGVAG